MGDEYDTIRGMSSHRVASRVGRKPRLGPSLGLGGSTDGTSPDASALTARRLPRP